MNTFMGPMTPPPAAPAQPQALDIRTNPNQRQQFKQFMKQRTATMPMTSAPIAQPSMMPMMQPPMPMGQDIDIFNPVNLHEGGIVPSLSNLQQQAAQFSEQLQSTVMGGGGSGGGMSNPFVGNGPNGMFGLSQPAYTEATPLLAAGSQRPALESTIYPPRGMEGMFGNNAVTNLDRGSPQIDQGFKEGGSVHRNLVEKTHKDGRRALYKNNGSTFVRFVDEDEKPPLLSFAKFKEALGFEDGGSVPPRNTDIRGQDHMLSYITPDEADILMALGGSGEAGPMGIPAFRREDGPGSEGFGSEASSYGGGNTGGGGDDGGDGGDTYSDMGMSPGRSQAQFGTTEFAGKSVQEAENILDAGGGSDEAQAVQQSIATQQANQAARQRADQLVRDAVSGSASARQSLINQRPSQVNEEIAQLKSDPANLGSAGQFLSQIRNAPTTGTGIASVGAGLRDTRGPDAGRLDLLDIDNLLTDQFTERDLVTDAGPVVESYGPSRRTLGDSPVYSSVLNNPMYRDEKTMNPADFEAQYGFAPRGVTGSVFETPSIGIMTPSDDLNTDDMTLVNTPPEFLGDIGAAGLGVDIPTSAATTTTPTATTTSAPIGMDDEYDNIVGTPDYDDPNRAGYSAGLPIGVKTIDTPQGTFTTNLAGTTAAQRAAMPGYMSTRDPADPISGEVRAGFVPGAVDFVLGNPVTQAYGFEIPDLATGEITGMTGPSNMPGMIGSGLNFLQDLFLGPAENTEDLLQRGVYTGFGPGSQIGVASGTDDDPPVKAPTDPCPDGFVLKNGVCTPIDSGAGNDEAALGGGAGQPPPPPAPVIVPSPRQPVQPNLQGPVGYGMPTAGQINPFAVSSAGLYQQMLNQQAANPIRLQDGGSVSSRLDQAAGNFLKALQPAA